MARRIKEARPSTKAGRAATKRKKPPHKPGRKLSKVKSKTTTRGLIASTKKQRPVQNPVGTTKLLGLNPVVANKQLIVKAQTFPKTAGRTKPYLQTMVFGRVEFVNKQTKKHPLPVGLKSGDAMYMENLSSAKHPIQVRCSCENFRFEWHWWDGDISSLAGPRIPYQRVSPPSGWPEVNPQHIPGLCKHLLNVVKRLQATGVMKRRKTA